MNRPDGTVPAPRESGPPLVLIIEDEEPLAEMVSFVVQQAGWAAAIALDGRQGLDLARARRPALLITDLMLPHLDGADVIAAVRADAADGGPPAPPVILMTAANLPQARAAGADAVLRKPFRIADLQALLARFAGIAPAPAQHTQAGNEEEDDPERGLGAG